MAIGLGGAIAQGLAMGATGYLNQAEKSRQDNILMQQKAEADRLATEQNIRQAQTIERYKQGLAAPRLYETNQQTGVNELVSPGGEFPSGIHQIITQKQKPFSADSSQVDAVIENPEIFGQFTGTPRGQIIGELYRRGYKNLAALNPENIKQTREIAQSTATANVLINNLDELSKPLFTAKTIPGQYLQGIENYIGEKTLTSDSALVYARMQTTFLSNLSRAFGEKGVLTDNDVARVKKAFPTYGMSEVQRDNQIKELRGTISDIAAGKTMAFTTSIPLQKKQKDEAPKTGGKLTPLQILQNLQKAKGK